MTDRDFGDTDELREWLDYVEDPETTKWLMAMIAVSEGVSPDELEDWYGFTAEDVRTWIDELESDPPVIPIATFEGVDFESLATASGLGRETIVQWFRALDSRPTAEVADIVGRYSRRTPHPLFSGSDSRVHYLNQEAIDEHGWSIEDDDLFEKASAAGLDKSDYGRFLVKSNETILEAAENRSISWPYACRGGACANCAVIVTEGDVAMPGQTILTDEQVQEMNARLTCVGIPVTDEVKLVMNVQHLDQFQDLRLPSPLAGAEPSI